VAAPALIEREAIEAPADIGRLTLLVQATRPAAWEEWFAAEGLTTSPDQPSLAFEQFALVIRAAASGLGAAMVPEFLARDELARGEVVRLFGQTVASRQGYYLAYPPENRDLPPLAAFRDWLLDATTAERAAPA
jgi:DNA-binding transcriptional LysR family regulator